jgi:hypothetical protein
MPHVHTYIDNSGIPPGAVPLTVSVGKHRYVSAAGLVPADKLVLYRKACQEANCPNDGTAVWAPVIVCGKDYSLRSNNTLMCISIPGDYYLAFESGTPPAGVQVCVDDELPGSQCECGC